MRSESTCKFSTRMRSSPVSPVFSSWACSISRPTIMLASMRSLTSLVFFRPTSLPARITPTRSEIAMTS